ncbi:hypothetical protein NW752_001992 [Fusarium irregulare]|uniref:Uncharacterized protein n=1 Tax=Fusarium irregulare TaxID=2494466 RepID=A0A9W8UB11_9HYPO|nr:hypothetical protein NW766_004154 [Fusarium irregulare]KAJ4027032.1 hypothetical protein NW752_001992 [Fusarium irregulare]
MVRDAPTIIADLCQPHSAKKRKYAIPQFTKALRREDRFQAIWEDVGGASGLASLMAEFSIRDLRELCKRLGMTASAQQVRSQRRAALSELVEILYQRRGREDSRPVDRFYQHIIPACNLEVVQRFEQEQKIEWTISEERLLLAGHPQLSESKLLQEAFSKDNLLFAHYQSLLRGNIHFTRRILTTLLVKDKVNCPPDLLDEVAMPLLKALRKSRYNNETRSQHLDLVLQCIRKHQDALSGQLVLTTKGGLVQYIVDRWSDAPKGNANRRQLELHLVQAIKLIPTLSLPRGNKFEHLHQAISVSEKLSHEERYEFFRLLLLHLQGFAVDIESDSEQDLSRLKQDSRSCWPSSLFFCMNERKSLRLFEKLEKLFPQRDFLSVERETGTVLHQSQGVLKYSPVGDFHVAKALLIRRSKTQHERSEWPSHGIELVKERRVKAQQSREAVERAYWAISALNLCVSVGDLATLRETIVWSQRFIKDSAVTARLFTSNVFKLREMEELLGAMPDEDFNSPTAAIAFTTSLVKKDIELANQVLVEMVSTVAMAVGEPGFQATSWSWVIDLVRSTADRRTSKLDVFFENLSKCNELDREKCQRDLLDIVWKPTTDLLIQIGAIVHDPALKTTNDDSLHDTLVSGSHKDSVNGIYLYRRIANTPISPHLLAELTKSLIDQTRERLGSRGLRAQMQNIVFAINRLATSDQPSLACPFICDLVLDNDGQETSSWHRHLLSPRFLSILPARAAQELLCTMANVMSERMRAQNQNTDKIERTERVKDGDATEGANPSETKQSGEPSVHPIKVTTIKMLAQLLQHKVFINSFASCEILILLLSEARHIDIRTTITNSLFAILEDPASVSSIRKQILDALDKYCVPVAAQLNERRGLAESDWADASEHGSGLPIIGEDTPLLDLMIEKAHLAKLEEADKSRLVQLVMRAIEQSAAQNSRWLNLFMTKNHFSLDEQLPELPVHLAPLTKAFIQLRPYAPLSFFSMVEAAAFNRIDPLPGVKRITQSIEEDRDLINSNAGKHWRAQFSSGRIEGNRYNAEFIPFHVATLMQERPELSEAELTSLQSLVTTCAAKMLKVNSPGQVVSLVRKLCEKRLKDRENWGCWTRNCLPCIKTIIQMTKDAQARPRTKDDPLPWLPSVFQLNLYCLPFPLSDATDAEVKNFVEELYKMIRGLSERQNRPYHLDFENLKREINYWPSKQSFGCFALKLNAVQVYDFKSPQPPSLADFLSCDIISHLIMQADDSQDIDADGEIKLLVREWENCNDDTIRAMGINLKLRKYWMND